MVATERFDLERRVCGRRDGHGYLLVLADRNQRRALRLYDGRALVGSHPSCHLQIRDEAVSPCHLEVSVTEEGLSLRDLGSQRGTWLSGRRVTHATVQVGTSVSLGSCELMILPLLKPRGPGAERWTRVQGTGHGGPTHPPER